MKKRKLWKTLLWNCLNSHDYFWTIWPYLPPHKKDKTLDIIAEGKGVIPYEIIVDMESFFIKPEGTFWEKSEFFSGLKQKVVDSESYEKFKISL